MRSSREPVVGTGQARTRPCPRHSGVWIVSGLVRFCFSEFCCNSKMSWEAIKGFWTEE